jgi:hypothetical protein
MKYSSKSRFRKLLWHIEKIVACPHSGTPVKDQSEGTTVEARFNGIGKLKDGDLYSK